VRAVANPADEVSVKRILNVPKRGIGDTTIARLDGWAIQRGVTFSEALAHADEAAVSGAALRGIRAFTSLLHGLRVRIDEGPAVLVRAALEDSGYLAELDAEHSVEAVGRLENLSELVGAAEQFETVDAFLEQVALVADTDQIDDDDSRVILMTLHSAKGLEFPVVLLVGAEEGVFPHIRALTEPDELEEERRLAYVGITRARERFYVTHAWSRSLFGSTQYNPPSRFIDEIPSALVTNVGDNRRSAARNSWRARDDNDEAWRYRRDRRDWSSDPARERMVDAALRSANLPPVGTTGAESLGLRIGDAVRHARYGDGIVIDIRGEGDKAEATVRFREAGQRTFILAWSPLQKQ
jgi:DNA helicase-2/ATP-dependent DNA helicase PcrA